MSTIDETISPNSTLTGLPATQHGHRALCAPQRRVSSSLFTVSRTINPLVAAASPLVTLGSHLHEKIHTQDPADFLQMLSHEVRAFESKAQRLGYRAQVVLAARYLLCTYIDEAVMRTAWGDEHEWHEQGLLMTFQNEVDGGTRSFYIIERCADEPSMYLELLELSYLLLSFGMQGKYVNTPLSQQHVDEHVETLYQLIIQERGEPTKQLHGQDQASLQPKQTRRQSLLPVWVTLTFAALLSVGVYIPYKNHLHTQATPLAAKLNAIGAP